MRKLLGMMLLFAALGAAPGLRADASDTLAGYALGGAGLGAVMGSALATVPYLSDKQGFDFMVGAGLGAVSGAGLGLILGCVDVASQRHRGQARLGRFQEMRFSLAPRLRGGGELWMSASF